MLHLECNGGSNARTQYRKFTIWEENSGAGAAVSECLAAHGVAVRLLHLGLPDRFIQHGGRGDMLADAGLDAAGIARSVEEYLARHTGAPDAGESSDGARSAGQISATGK